MEEREDKGAPDKECVAEIIGNRALHESCVKSNLREIIPIRFLPLYTNRSLAPAVVPLLFAGNHDAVKWREAWGPEQALTAYHCRDGKIIALTKFEWDAILDDVRWAKKMSRERQEGPDERLVALLKALPVAFVRREEFDAAYQSLLLPKEAADYRVVTGENGEPELETVFADQTEERPSLNDSPCILPELSPVVFQGFVQETGGNHAATVQGKPAVGKKKYFTVEQVAKITQIPSDELFAVMHKNPEKSVGTKWLFPGVEIIQPLAVTRFQTTGKNVAESNFPGGGLEYESFDEEITGFFELYDLPALDSTVHTEPVSCLHTPDMQGVYRIPGGCSFRKDQLRISAGALVYFLEESRIQVPQFLVDLCNGEGFEPFEDEGTERAVNQTSNHAPTSDEGQAEHKGINDELLAGQELPERLLFAPVSTPADHPEEIEIPLPEPTRADDPGRMEESRLDRLRRYLGRPKDFVHQIQPEAPGGSNASGPVPPPSPTPNESTPSAGDAKEEQSAVSDELPTLEAINRMPRKEKAAFWRRYAEQNSNKARGEIAYELAGMGTPASFIGKLWEQGKAGEVSSAASHRGKKLISEGEELKRKKLNSTS